MTQRTRDEQMAKLIHKRRWILYECKSCRQSYANELSALRCCKEVKITKCIGYPCFACGEYLDSVEKALKCCPEEEDGN